jgi:arsenate reductase
MYLDANELVILYNENASKSKETLAYAHTISSKINKQELTSVRVSSTLFEMMLKGLNLDGKGVVNKALPYYQEHLKGADLNLEDWFGVLCKNPELLIAPIVMYKGHVVLCNTPTDILKIKNAKTAISQE